MPEPSPQPDVADRLGGRIAIVGAGAIGLYYGARLAARGENVAFLVRSDYDAIRADGIRVESVDGDLSLADARVFREAAEIGPVDWILVTWKATANGHFEDVLGPLVGDDTRILTLQNGLGNVERLAELFPRSPILGGLCFVCINRVGPGHIRHTAGGKITVGEWRPDPAARPLARQVAAALRAAGVPGEPTDSLARAQWRKLVWNIPFNGLAIAAGGVTTDRLLADPETEARIRRLMAEVIAAARALGHEIEDSVIDFEIDRTRPMGAYRPSSMIDFVDGRPVEYEAIWAEPLRRAREAGVAVPELEALAAEIREKLEGKEWPEGS